MGSRKNSVADTNMAKSDSAPSHNGNAKKAKSNNTEMTTYGSVNNEKPKSHRAGKDKSLTAVENPVMDACAMRPHDDNLLESLPCYQKLHNKFGFKVFVFLLVFALDAADLVSDWLLFRDVAMTEEGLVYGPVADSIKYSLLAFSVVGTFTFTFEIINLWWEVFRNNPWVDTDMLSAITIWIEDVPQIVISIFIAACREEAISYFQLVKASVIIIGALIRVIVSLVRYCGKRARHDLECAGKNKESLRHVVYRVFIMLGLLITLSGAIAVFIFTQSERNPDGSINFKLPHSVLRGEYDDQKYFHNVSVYFSHPLLDYNGALRKDNINWLRLLSIHDVRQDDIDPMVKIEFDNPRQKIVIYQSDAQGNLKVNECFTINRTTKSLTMGTSCAGFITGTKSDIIFKFHFIKAKIPGLVFGDIKFNMVVNDKGTCHAPATSTSDTTDGRVTNPVTAAVHYFRTRDGVSGTNHVISTQSQFYHSYDLIDIPDIWKTGFATCKSTGSLAPHHDTDIPITCP